MLLTWTSMYVLFALNLKNFQIATSFLTTFTKGSIDNRKAQTLGLGNSCSLDCTIKTADGHEVYTASARKGAVD